MLAGVKATEKEYKGARQLRIFIKGRNFRDLDGIRNKSDTQVTLYIKWRRDQLEWTEVDSTEVVPDNLNPNFNNSFAILHNFGQIVHLRFVVNNINGSGEAGKQLLGKCEISLIDLLKKSSKFGYEIELEGGVTKPGSLILGVRETSTAQKTYKLELQAVNLPSLRRWIDLNFSDTYFMEIYRGNNRNNVKVYESEWFVNDLNHRFEPIKISDAHLCGCDPKAAITIKLINRNQFTMTNTEVCCLVTNIV